MTRKLKVGFDLDGVILYNPIRVLRPVASALRFFKPLLFHEKKDSFYFPNSPLEKLLWKILHKTSFKIADGVEEIKKLSKKGAIEPYIITARYSFLKDDFNHWVKKLNNKPYFKYCHYNKNDIQPNAFKEKMIKELKLDVFIEDNWGVIQKLNGSLPKTKIFWVSNILDRNIKYQYKFFSLQEAIDYLATLISG